MINNSIKYQGLTELQYHRLVCLNKTSCLDKLKIFFRRLFHALRFGHFETNTSLKNRLIHIKEKNSLPDSLKNLKTFLLKQYYRTNWLSNFEIDEYSRSLKERYPYFKLEACYTLYNYKNIADQVLGDLNQATLSKQTVLAYPLNIKKDHWTLLYIDKKKRTVEYYDSLKNYASSKEMKAIKNIAKIISEREVTQSPYQFISKIRKTLQPDDYQCGVWTIYFLEERLKNPDVDFNQLNVKQAQKMIANYRSQVRENIVKSGRINYS